MGIFGLMGEGLMVLLEKEQVDFTNEDENIINHARDTLGYHGDIMDEKLRWLYPERCYKTI